MHTILELAIPSPWLPDLVFFRNLTAGRPPNCGGAGSFDNWPALYDWTQALTIPE